MKRRAECETIEPEVGGGKKNDSEGEKERALKKVAGDAKDVDGTIVHWVERR